MEHKPIRVILKPAREQSVRRRHPWVFSGAIDRAEGEVRPGTPVELCSSKGEFLARGFWGEGSIAVRVLSYHKKESIADSVRRAIGEAFELRRSLGMTSSTETTMYRLVNGEGDGAPGLIVDRYGSNAVIQCHATGMLELRDVILETLLELPDTNFSTIYDKSGDLFSGSRERELERPTNMFLRGSETSSVELELNSKFEVGWTVGQKTGFFLDQRDNRALCRSLAQGARVLNLFSYTGGFSVSAFAGGAREVVSVDASAGALQTLEKNLELNSITSGHQTIETDCFKFLDTHDQQYEIVVLDPPALAKHQKAVRAGARAYEQLNLSAARLVAPGGYLLTFSCSQLVGNEDFRELVRRGVGQVGAPFRVLRSLGAAACHPTNLFHPEGSYLKGLLLQRGRE